MSLKKIKFNLFFIISVLILSSFSVFSACIYTPSYIKVVSGINNLGNFNSGDNVFIKSDLASDSLRLSFVFNNTQAGCFDNSTSQVRFQLFPAGSDVESDSIVTTSYDNDSYFLTKADFLFNPSVILTNTLYSSYVVKGSVSGSLVFEPDFDVPLLNYIIEPVKPVYSAGTLITISYSASDDKSGIKSVVINGAGTEVNDVFNGSSLVSNNLSFTLDSSSDLTFKISDMLGNSIEESQHFVVDSTAPQFSNFTKVYSFVNNARYISFGIYLSDESFNYTSAVPSVSADLSGVNSAFTNSVGVCSKVSSVSYKCSWNNVPISLDSTQNVVLTFTGKDSLENNATDSENTEIFVDKLGPEILEFYFQNGYGQTNIFRPTDNSSFVYLRLRDSSFALGMSPKINYDFDKLSMIAPTCSKSVDNTQDMICVWNFGKSLLNYAEAKNDTLIFKLVASDEYKNVASANITVSIDNSKPVFESVELVETESIHDGIIKSGEIFNFRAFLNEDNLLVNGTYNVYAMLSLVDKNSALDVLGNCQKYNETTVQCDFNNIEARNGYINTSVKFYAIDSAGNYNNYNYSLEILKIGDEVPDAFRVVDMNRANIGSVENLLILNPVNREMLSDSGVNSWFRGKLILLDSESQYRLVNYALKECSWESETAILSNKESLFGGQNNVKIYQNEGDEEFALKVELHDHPNYNDMNDIYMNCTLSVVKRDNQTIYGTNLNNAEEVNVKLKFTFYATPRGDLLKANAAKIVEMIDEAEVLGSWFDTTYKIYNIFNSVCTVINGAGGMLNTLVSVLNGVQMVSGYCDTMTGGICTGPAKSISELTKGEIFGMMTNKDGVVKKMCDWVTCRNGATLISMDNIPGVSDYMAFNDKLCSIATDSVLSVGSE